MEYKLRVGRQEAVVRENLLDRVVRWVDPVRGQQRLAARAGQAVMAAAAGGYTGGRRDKRSLSSFTPKGNSANADLLPDLSTLRERSRDLVRNEPIAAGAINTVTTSVVGTGLMLKSRIRREVLGWSEEAAAAWPRQAEYEFCLGGVRTFCDVTRAQNFYGLQDLAFRSTLENGDTLALLPFVPRIGFPYQLAVQLIEADRVSNKDSQRDTPQLAGGVEMDARGAPVRYHVMNQHPGDLLVTKREWTLFNAFGAKSGRRNVLHLYAKRRIGQTRGVPYFAPVIEAFKQIGRYTEAEISAAVLSSMIAIVTKTADRGGLNPLESAVGGTTPQSGASDTAHGGGWDGTLTPGLAVDMGLDEEVEAFKGDGRPNPQFDPFVQAVLRQVGVALELPFEVLIKHFTASYSAARSSLLEAWRFYRCRRYWLADAFCQPVYEAWMEEAVALGRLSAPGFFDDALLRAAYLGSEWHGDGPGSIDPAKEVNAAEKRVNMNLTTLEREIAEYNGSDFESVIEQRGRERVALKKADLIVEPASQGTKKPGEPGKNGEEDGTEARAPVNLFLTVPSEVRHEVNHRPLQIEGLHGAVDAMGKVAAGVEKSNAVVGAVAGAVREGNAATVQVVQSAAASEAQQSAAVIRAVQETGRATSEGQRELVAEIQGVVREIARPRKLICDTAGNPIGNEPA
jgi:lambda family phage portal protein